VRNKGGEKDSRTFLAGLLDWVGDSVPVSQNVTGAKIKEKGFAHIKTIVDAESQIMGFVEPSWGYSELVEETDSIRTWGYNVINILANKYFVEGEGTQRTDQQR
jgi:hypothetical protein